MGSCKQAFASLAKSWRDTKHKCTIKCKGCGLIINITDLCDYLGEVQFSEKEVEWINTVRKSWEIIDFESSPQKTNLLLDKCCIVRIIS